MPIKVACKCGKVINAPDKYEGKTAKCPACKEPLKIIAAKAKKAKAPVEEVVEQEESKPKAKSSKKGVAKKKKMGKMPRKGGEGGSDKKSKRVKADSSSKSDRRSRRVKKGGSEDAKKSKLPLIIILVVALLAGAGAAYYFIFMQGDAPAQTENNVNGSSEKPSDQNSDAGSEKSSTERNGDSNAENTESSAVNGDTSTAEATVQTFINSMIDKKPGHAWDMLPSKHQEDIGKLKAAFAANMDKVVYDKAFAIISKLTNILESKKDLILSHPMLGSSPVPKDDISKNWDSIVSVLKIISESDLSSIDKVKNANVKNFANKTIGDLLVLADKLSELVPGQKGKAGLMEELKGMTIKVKDSTEDSARLVVEDSGSKENALAMVKVDGKWLPKEMAENWDKEIQSAIENLEKMKANPMASMQSIAVLAMVEGVLDKFNEIKTADELNALIQSTMGQVGPMLMGGGIPKQAPKEDSENMELIEF